MNLWITKNTADLRAERRAEFEAYRAQRPTDAYAERNDMIGYDPATTPDEQRQWNDITCGTRRNSVTRLAGAGMAIGIDDTTRKPKSRYSSLKDAMRADERARKWRWVGAWLLTGFIFVVAWKGFSELLIWLASR